MKAQIIKIAQVTDGSVEISVRVALQGKSPRTITVEERIPKKNVFNSTGWVQAADGSWHRPWKLVNGNWQWWLDPAIEWAQAPITEEDIQAVVRPHLVKFVHQEVVEAVADLGPFTDEEYQIRIVPKGPVHLDTETGMVQIEIEAFDAVTDESLWVDDGFWAMHNPPTIHEGKEDLVTAYKKTLAMVVRRSQP